VARWERYGTRDLTYSNWHRHFIDDDHADYVDIDSCEYCHYCKAPLALIEVSRDVGQSHKTATVLRMLGRKANLPAWVVLYTPDVSAGYGISGFRVRAVWPKYTAWQRVTPAAWSERIKRLHAECLCLLLV